MHALFAIADVCPIECCAQLIMVLHCMTFHVSCKLTLSIEGILQYLLYLDQLSCIIIIIMYLLMHAYNVAHSLLWFTNAGPN